MRFDKAEENKFCGKIFQLEFWIMGISDQFLTPKLVHASHCLRFATSIVTTIFLSPETTLMKGFSNCSVFSNTYL